MEEVPFILKLYRKYVSSSLTKSGSKLELPLFLPLQTMLDNYAEVNLYLNII